MSGTSSEHDPWLGFATARLSEHCAHDGTGQVRAARVVDRADGSLAWIDLVVVPAGVSIGRHTHGEDEEMYIVLDGAATMVVDGVRREIAAGDVVHNRAGGTHELLNEGPEDLRMVVIDVRTDP